MKKNQKIRVLINGVGILTTVGKVKDTFCTTPHLNAVLHCLEELKKGKDQRGILTTHNGVSAQVDILICANT